MVGKVGDEIVVDGPHLGDLPRRGEVLEVRNTGDVVHYRVRWDDGGGPTASTSRVPTRVSSHSAPQGTRRQERPADGLSWERSPIE